MIRVERGLTQRGNGAESLSRRDQVRVDPTERANRRNSRRQAPYSIESSRSPGYYGGVKSDIWGITVERLWVAISPFEREKL